MNFLVLTALVLLAMLGGLAGIYLEKQRAPAQPAWRNPAVRDALLPIAGWASLFVLDFAVTQAGGQNLPVGFRHLLGTLAVLLLYYAVLATLRLIYRSLRRIHARIRPGSQPLKWRPIPILGRLAFPTLFVSAAFAALSVLWFDGLTQNLAFSAGVVALVGIIGRRRPPAAAPAQRPADE
jgi:hypothetical protein